MASSRPCTKLRSLSAIVALGIGVLGATHAWSAPPKVVTSIKPVQALVKMVMGALGTPDLIIPATASPHVFSLKPSQAKMLAKADAVFWIGPALETTLNGPLEKLSQNARVVALMAAPGLDLIKRESRNIQDAEKHDGHDHGAADPHVWLSPSNAKVMVEQIAQVLSQLDPPNAPEYAANAKKAKRRISILINQTNAFSANMKDTPYLVQHDAFGYLAREFKFQEAGYLQTTPGREPGAKHISGLLDTIKTQQVKCLFHEPQFTPKLARRLSEEYGLSLREIDPLGADLSLSNTTYVRIIQSIIVAMQSCLSSGAPADAPK